MKIFQKEEKLMGSHFTFGIVSECEQNAKQFLQMGIDEVKRLENRLSEFLNGSDVWRLNHAENTAISVSKECFELLQRCLHLSQLTNGDFDITTKPLKQLYSFQQNELSEFPSKSKIDTTLQKVGYQNISLNQQGQLVSILNDAKISFAGIGKGFASDCVKKIWQELGVQSGFINASGDLNAFGQKPNGESWVVSISNPEQKNEILLSLPIHHAAIATSGDYEQFFEHKGERYSHTIHPKTGLPIQNIKSVTVYSPSAELSDALATAVFVKGVENGIAFINQLPQTHCIIINSNHQVYFSNELNYEEASNHFS